MRNPAGELEFAASPRRSLRRLFVWLVAGELALVVLDTTINRSGWVSSGAIQRLFNIAREDSLANFLGSVQELAVAGVALIIFLHARGTGRWVAAWGVVVAFFTWVGVDDGAVVHERVGTALEDSLSFFPSYTWQVIFVPIFALAALVTLIVVWREAPRPALRWVMLSGFGCWAFAVILDYLDGRGLNDEIADAFGLGVDVFSHYSKVLEEFLEDFGTTLFLLVLLRLLMTRAAGLRISFGDPERR